jgi:hypothetical protein
MNPSNSINDLFYDYYWELYHTIPTRDVRRRIGVIPGRKLGKLTIGVGEWLDIQEVVEKLWKDLQSKTRVYTLR